MHKSWIGLWHDELSTTLMYRHFSIHFQDMLDQLGILKSSLVQAITSVFVNEWIIVWQKECHCVYWLMQGWLKDVYLKLCGGNMQTTLDLDGRRALAALTCPLCTTWHQPSLVSSLDPCVCVLILQPSFIVSHFVYPHPPSNVPP